MIDSTNLYGSTVTYLLSLFRNNLEDVESPTAKGEFVDCRDINSTWVVSSFPQPKKYGDFPGYPIVIVNSPDISQERFAHRNVKKNNAEVMVSVLDKGKTPINCDDISGQIRSILDNHWTSTIAQGIRSINIRTSSQPIMNSGDDTIVREFILEFEYRTLPNYRDD